MALEHDSDSVIAMAVRKAGSQSAFGRLIGKRQSTVAQWLKAGRLPPEHVLAVEEATGVSRHDLRPDIYPDERTPAAAALDYRPATPDPRYNGARP